ncbi:MAG: DNA polymerase III subunit gamma/tau, partial [Rhodothermales bacterium]|nr:DNA polymerase III subunit gamma/tau [Rhodothermales bacterium]
MSEKRFLVTARKYRPQLFNELVAQEHVTGTLKNAIRLDRLAHAYLFTGPRGVGKTTAARILAKAINCTTAPEERGDSAEPCRACDSCRSFEEGRNLNIIEIDAASNNKVDDVRDLRETVRIPPQGNRKKVYIVDEVHMLTNQAFNALLKTLEEPPPHVLFIFATTEPHKVLATIQSRCQRFDFRRIPVQETVSRLEEICTAEGVTADDGSLMLVARKGDGALRDALSVFDQAVSLCGTTLTHAQLVEALGVVSEELFFEVTDHIASSNVGGMLQLVDRVVAGGYDLQEFLDGLAEHLRNLLVAKSVGDTGLIEASEATRKQYMQAAGQLTEHQVLRLLATIDQTLDSLRTARQPRLRLELALVKMASLPATTDLRSALAKVDELVKAGPVASSVQPSAASAPGPPSAPVQAAPAAAQPEPAPAPTPAPAPESAPEPAVTEESNETPRPTPPKPATAP